MINVTPPAGRIKVEFNNGINIGPILSKNMEKNPRRIDYIYYLSKKSWPNLNSNLLYKWVKTSWTDSIIYSICPRSLDPT